MSISDILFGCEVREESLDALPALLKARFPYGNYLVLTDEENALALGKVLKRHLKKLVLVIEEGEDVLPLFASPDAITCVVGAGKAINAARYFACVRSLPFVAVALSCTPAGLLIGTVKVRVAEKETEYPVPPPQLIFADSERMSENGDGLRSAQSFLFACELALFSFEAARLLKLQCTEKNGEQFRKASFATEKGDEQRFTSEFHGQNALSDANGERMPIFSDGCGSRPRRASEDEDREQNVSSAVTGEELFSLLSAACAFSEKTKGEIFSPQDAELLFRATLTAEYCFRSGFPQEEIFCFASLASRFFRRPLEKVLFPCVCVLTELYALFFDDGFYRGAKADYNARLKEAEEIAEKAGICAKSAYIPTAEELKTYAENFGGCKKTLSEKISLFGKRIEKYKENFEEVFSKTEKNELGKILRLLPELSLLPYGLSALMRDFSLL